jgi:predicted SAM-dependent methyltransferase
MNPYISLPKVPIVIGRQDFVVSRCRGKKVLHLGCVDSGSLHERFLRGELMHQKLAEVAAELWGIDIDADGISFLRSQGFDNLVVGDVCSLDKIPEFQERSFDIIVASEIIEHLMNPGLFLNAVEKLMIPGHTELIVTVPNAFRISTLIQLWYGVEYIHPDHNYWFSYATVTGLLRKAGFEIKEIYVYSFESTKILSELVSKFFRRKNTRMTPRLKAESSSFTSRVQIIGYLKLLLRRLVMRVLYKRTPFWGDGIIVFVRKPGK